MQSQIALAFSTCFFYIKENQKVSSVRVQNQIILFLLFLVSYGYVFSSFHLHDADSTKKQILSGIDGSMLVGHTVRIQNDTLWFQSEFGLFSIPYAKIKSILPLSVSEKFRFSNPHTTRLFFAPTGEMLEKGQGYFQDIFLFFVGGAYGISPHVTMGGGVSLIPGTSQQLYYLTPKIGFPIHPNIKLALGTLWAGVTDETEHVGIHYGVISIRESEANFTLGLGYGYAGSQIAKHPVGIIGGLKRISQRLALVSENWFLHGSSPVTSLGIRFLGEKLAVDLAFVRPLEMDLKGLPAIPYVDFAVIF